MSRLETLIEQTTFLLEKQEQVKQECDDLFNDFLAFLQEKMDDFNEDSEQAESIGRVYDMVSGHAQKITDDAQSDIDFLREQLQALIEVAQVNDVTKSRELLNAMISEDEELPTTEEFKENIMQDSVEAKSSLLAMIDDIKDALREGDIKEVELLLEAMVQEEDEEDDEDGEYDIDEEDYDDEEEEEEEDGCCGSGGCAEGGCGSCKTGCGPKKGSSSMDVFSYISQYDRELADDDIPSDGTDKKKFRKPGRDN